MTKFISRAAAIALVGLLSVAAPGAALAVSSSGQNAGAASAGVNSGPDGGLQINSTTAGSPGAVHRRYFANGGYFHNCGPLYRWSLERHMCVVNNPAL